jgi:hypothetical protein
MAHAIDAQMKMKVMAMIFLVMSLLLVGGQWWTQMQGLSALRVGWAMW